MKEVDLVLYECTEKNTNICEAMNCKIIKATFKTTKKDYIHMLTSVMHQQIMMNLLRCKFTLNLSALISQRNDSITVL